MDENANSADFSDSADELLVLQDAPAALVLEVWEPTGDSTVDSALEDLRALDTADLADHVEIFSSIHDQLRGRLIDLSDAGRA